MLVVRVLEEIEDPLLLEKARYEIKVRLTVLDAEFPLRIAPGAFDLKVRVPLRLEDLLHDLEHAQVLEDLAVARQ